MNTETFKQIFESSQDGFIIARKNVILDCNEALVHILGYDTKKELLSLHASDISPEFQDDGLSSYTKSNENLKRAIDSNGYRFEWLHKKKNEDTVYCEVTLTPIVHENEAAIFASVRDISDRKLLQASNKKLTTRLELAFSGNEDGIFDWDIENDSIYYSPSWKQMIGYEDNELENTMNEWEIRVHPDDLQESYKDVEAYLDSKTSIYENQHRLKHKDGSWVWILARGKAKFNEEGKAFRFVGTHTNITKEKSLEEELIKLNNSLEEKISIKTMQLQISRDYFKTIFNSVKDGIAILDVESNFLMVNDSYSKMTGFTKEELYRMSCVELTTKDMIEESTRVLKEVIEKGSYMDYEKICIVANEKELPVKMDITLMPDKTQLLLVVKDLTLKNKRKKEKAYQEQQMIQHSRLAQMGEMISMIAHQWRQPLGAISTTSANLALKLELNSFALDSEESKNEFKKYFLGRLDNIESYVESLTTTVDDFRNFYKPNKNLFSITLNTVFSKSLNIIKSSLLAAGVEINYVSNASKKISIYESEIMHVILNILKNAQDNFIEQNIKYPKLTIHIENESISIEDNAGGIPDTILEKIYDPYFSTKDEKNGTGLGLYMSKLIVEDHHKGKLLAQNINEGACFTIELQDLKK
ncbi:PAS domain S-box protein [Sulfurimonas sp.]|nr:PAS domain S-box protein [Sulfurimonas sp.]